MQPRRHQGRSVRAENAWGLPGVGQLTSRCSPCSGTVPTPIGGLGAAVGDVEIQEDGAARVHVRRSKADPEAGGRGPFTSDRMPARYTERQAADTAQWPGITRESAI